MPIQIPNLDDRNYEQLLKEADGVIARYFPEYADLGPSDPAMALKELFCYYFDVTMYQLNRVTPAARNNFASLLGIAPVYGEPPEEALRQALSKLSRVDRAITPADIETIIIKASQPTADDGAQNELLCSEPVLRVCVRGGTGAGDPVRVFIVQRGAISEIKKKHRTDLLNLYAYLRSCGPIGTRYIIAHSPISSIDVSTEIVKRTTSTISSDKLATDIKNKLIAYIHPLTGGDGGNGWEFGKPISRGDIYGLIEGMPGVDHVKSLYIKNYISEKEETYFGTDDTLSPAEYGLLKLNQAFVTVK